MNVIIREIYWQEYDTATQIRTVRADITCDAIADLPSGGVMTDYKLDIGSRAHVIADGSDWEIQSTGSWVRQPGRLQLDLTGYATEQYVDDGLAAKVDTTTYTSGQSAQDAVIGTKITMQQAYGDAISIPANADLNDYSTPGLYYALVANAPTIANTPYTATGLRLVVWKNTPAGSAVFQFMYPTSRSRLEFYRRVYEGGSWSAWYRFDGTQV